MSMKLYRYYTLYRPPMPGAIPKCTYSIRDYNGRKFVREIGRGAWGHVDCMRQLSEDEIAAYELVPAPENDIDNDTQAR